MSDSTELDLMAVINDQQFQHIAGILRKCFYSRYWRDAHPKVSFLGRLGTITKMAKRELMKSEEHRLKIHEELTGLLRDISKSNYRDGFTKVRHSDMSYTEDDATWLTNVLVSGNYRHAATIMSMLLAYASAKASPSNVENLYTPVEIADATGTSESGWRNKAAAGELSGAIKRGKQWLIPLSALGDLADDVISYYDTNES